MSVKNRDIRTQSLNIGNTEIPLGGEAQGVAVRISHGTVGELVHGSKTDIKTQPGRRAGVLTISCYPEDACSAILRALEASRSAAPGAAAVPLHGTFVNASLGQTSTWEDAHFIETADVIGGTATEVLTYQLALSGLVTVETPS